MTIESKTFRPFIGQETVLAALRRSEGSLARWHIAPLVAVFGYDKWGVERLELARSDCRHRKVGALDHRGIGRSSGPFSASGPAGASTKS